MKNKILTTLLAIKLKVYQAQIEKEVEAERAKEFKKAVLLRDLEAKSRFERHPADKKMAQRRKLIAKAVATVAKKHAKILQIDHTVKFSTKKVNSRYKHPPMNTVSHQITLKLSWVTKKVAATNYVTVMGDTLWQIAEVHYGCGYYWEDVRAASKGQILSARDKILLCAQLKLPSIEVPVILTLSKEGSAPKQARIPIHRTYPTVTYEGKLKSHAIEQLYVTPQFWIFYSIFIEGTLSATKKGEIPANFTFEKFDAEFSKKMANIDFGYAIKSFSPKGITLKGKFSAGNISLAGSVSPNGKFTVKATNVPHKLKFSGFEIEGALDIVVEFTIQPAPKMPKAKPFDLWSAVWEHKMAIASIALIVVPGGSAVWVIRGGVGGAGLLAF